MNEILKLTNEELRSSLETFREVVGPVTDETRKMYQICLWKLIQQHNKENKQVEHTPEVTRAVSNSTNGENYVSKSDRLQDATTNVQTHQDVLDQQTITHSSTFPLHNSVSAKGVLQNVSINQDDLNHGKSTFSESLHYGSLRLDMNEINDGKLKNSNVSDSVNQTFSDHNAITCSGTQPLNDWLSDDVCLQGASSNSPNSQDVLNQDDTTYLDPVRYNIWRYGVIDSTNYREQNANRNLPIKHEVSDPDFGQCSDNMPHNSWRSTNDAREENVKEIDDSYETNSENNCFMNKMEKLDQENLVLENALTFAFVIISITICLWSYFVYQVW